MKRKGYKNARFSWLGLIIFFITVAIPMQIAILVYDYVRVRTESKLAIAFTILGVVLIMSGVCTVIDVIRRRIMVEKPVEKILNATERIASGDFGARVEISHSYDKYDGYDRIAENLNTMARELGKSELLKSDFISNVSHEMKTPLAIIQNYTKMLEDDSLDEGTRKKYLNTVSIASKRLSNLVSDVLKLNKLENEEIRPEAERVDLFAQLSEAIIAYEAVIEEKGLSVECDLSEVSIMSVGAYLDIVWNNLLSNAIKFTPEGGTIFVSLKATVDGAAVSIRDTGVGMSAEVGSKIFEKFYQGDTSHKSEGNGLGLPMVKQVIDRLGGTISVESKLSEGSCFTIILRSEDR
ncbi:MAG: HAMP domain-containing histidine kinase [Clostridia bacterium]|nr:HAMP domain-containing histidine kinase [Clostridia bacterium]